MVGGALVAVLVKGRGALVVVGWCLDGGGRGV